MKRRPSWWVYLVGVMVLGAVYYPILKPAFEPWIVVVVALAYLVCLRLVGELVERKLRARTENAGHET